MRLVALLLIWLALIGSPSAFCQDLIAVAPQAARVEYEDARVRVVRLRIPPNGSIPMHDRPARVVISLTPNHVITSQADGTARTVHTAADSVAWSEPARRTVTNLADAPLENIIVELKTVAGPSKPAPHPPEPRPAAVLSEPRHRWLFENQYVRVYDVRIPAGETTEFHRHAYDSVYVYVSGGLVASQAEGEPWGKPENVDARTVAFSGDAAKPHTHRVRNDGKAEYRVVAVQLLN